MSHVGKVVFSSMLYVAECFDGHLSEQYVRMTTSAKKQETKGNYARLDWVPHDWIVYQWYQLVPCTSLRYVPTYLRNYVPTYSNKILLNKYSKKCRQILYGIGIYLLRVLRVERQAGRSQYAGVRNIRTRSCANFR